MTLNMIIAYSWIQMGGLIVVNRFRCTKQFGTACGAQRRWVYVLSRFGSYHFDFHALYCCSKEATVRLGQYLVCRYATCYGYVIIFYI